MGFKMSSPVRRQSRRRGLKGDGQRPRACNGKIELLKTNHASFMMHDCSASGIPGSLPNGRGSDVFMPAGRHKLPTASLLPLMVHWPKIIGRPLLEAPIITTLEFWL